MRSFPSTISDPTYDPDKSFNSVDRFFLSFIRDERDLPFIYLTMKISFFMIPSGLLLYVPGINNYVWWILAGLYFIMNNFVFKGPFGLMLHCTSHRPWFKKEYEWMNKYLAWIVGPFFGQTPETYASHHLGMHHRENNLENDLSSTMHYQRDSFREWLRYFYNFFFFGVSSLAQYFHRKQLRKLKNKVIRGEVLFHIVWIGLFIFDPSATFMVFVLPFLISRIIMMLGNWAQHSFVDYDEPDNCYKNSITCINTPYNKKCWNDGYHISHHIVPSLHWTLHPQHLKDNLNEYAENKALVFEGIEFLGVWWNLMNKRYDKLANYVVNINGMFESKEEIVELMKSRTAKMEERGITIDSLKLKAA
ncbi:MAG: fatty acid desaturase [Bacteroidota bacterium]